MAGGRNRYVRSFGGGQGRGSDRIMIAGRGPHQHQRR
jgi:hypothetical protein